MARKQNPLYQNEEGVMDVLQSSQPEKPASSRVTSDPLETFSLLERLQEKKDGGGEGRANVKRSPEQEGFRRLLQEREEVRIVKESYTFKLHPIIIQILEQATYVNGNKETGKKKKGAKGIIGAIANNALIKELVSLGLLDESSLKELDDYTQYF